MKIRDVLAINLKYYRKKLNLPQEKFAEVIGTSLSYLNQIENKNVDVRSSTIDKFADNNLSYIDYSKLNSKYIIQKSFNIINEIKKTGKNYLPFDLELFKFIYAFCQKNSYDLKIFNLII